MSDQSPVWEMRRADDVKAALDNAYDERNRVVAGLARLALDNGYAAWLGKHQGEAAEDQKAWDPGWENVVYVNLPTGQLSWHLHDSHLPFFAFLRVDETGKWDGHSTIQKYDRLDAFANRGKRA